jgi:hypothetical protein
MGRISSKVVRTHPTPEQCRRSRAALAQTEAQRARKPPAIPTERLRHLARRIHALGERPLFELLRELEAGAPLRPRLERYAELSSDVVKRLGADRLPTARIVRPARDDGGRQ